MTKRTILAGVALVLAALPAAPAAAEPNACDLPHEIDRYQLLRRLSLDLRNRVPSIEEYAALDATDTVPDDVVDAYLQSDEFRLAMRRYHEAMFWPNVSNVRLNNQNALISDKVPSAWMIPAAGRQASFRGKAGAHCGDYQQTSFDPKHPGEFRPIVDGAHTDADGTQHEGWRMVHPYWLADPTAKIPVCAFDAQETTEADDGKTSCDGLAGNAKPECGCGKNLMHCYGQNVASPKILGALREQLGRAVDDVVTGAAPYSDLILSTKVEENGPIAFWKKNLTPNFNYATAYDLPDSNEQYAATSGWGDDTWHEIDRGGLHAGILTSAAYLLRFQTNRGRANRFRIDFMCEYFVPPAELSPKDGCSEDSGDLTQRCNCQYCHEKLEPLAAYFGQFVEAGTTSLWKNPLLPAQNDACIGSKSQACARFYVTDPDAPHAGAFLAYQWANEPDVAPSTVHGDVKAHLAGGPRALAQSIVDDGTFATCAVENLWSHLMKRDIRAEGMDTDEAELLTELSAEFAGNGYDFPALARAIIGLPQYRRAR